MTRISSIKLGLLVAACGLGAAAPVAPALLLPLSEADITKNTESGCNFGFDVKGNKTLIFGINRTLMIRKAPGGSGLAQCRIPQATFDAFTSATGTATCSATKLTLRRTGKTTAHPEADSATFPATLTVQRGGKSWAAKGVAGTAC